MEPGCSSPCKSLGQAEQHRHLSLWGGDTAEHQPDICPARPTRHSWARGRDRDSPCWCCPTLALLSHTFSRSLALMVPSISKDIRW